MCGFIKAQISLMIVSSYTLTLWRQGKEGVHPIDNEYRGWSSDCTDFAILVLSPPEAREPEARGAGAEG